MKSMTYLFPRTPAYDLFPCTADIQAIVSTHVETVVLLSQLKQKPDDYINVTIELDDMDITSAETTSLSGSVSWIIFLLLIISPESVIKYAVSAS